MESLVHFIMSNGTMVVTLLLGGIIFCVFGLLLMSFHSPKLAVAQELGSIDRLEGVLRQMLSDQDFSKGKDDHGAADSEVALLKEQVSSLEKEVQTKSAQIDKTDDDTVLKSRIKELEAKLNEYSIIEEDISDLSKFRQENEELRNRINEVIGVPATEVLAMPWEEFEKVVKEKKSKSAKEDVITNIAPASES